MVVVVMRSVVPVRFLMALILRRSTCMSRTLRAYMQTYMLCSDTCQRATDATLRISCGTNSKEGNGEKEKKKKRI